MKTQSHRSMLVPVLLLGLLLLLTACQPIQPVSAANAGAGTAAEPATCTLATLKGRYLFAYSGMTLPPNLGVTEPTPTTDAGFHIFNGDGTGTDTVTLRVGNEVVLENFVTPFTYTVNADCTGTSTVTNGPSFGLFIDPNGETIAVILTDPPGSSVARIEQRVSSK